MLVSAVHSRLPSCCGAPAAALSLDRIVVGLAGKSITVGRGKHTGILEDTVSRKQVQVTSQPVQVTSQPVPSPGGAGAAAAAGGGGGVVILALGVNSVFAVTGGEGGQVRELATGVSMRLQVGDILELDGFKRRRAEPALYRYMVASHVQ